MIAIIQPQVRGAPASTIVTSHKSLTGLETIIADAVSSGIHVSDGATASGQTFAYNNVSSGNTGNFFVTDGRAPALWRFTAISNFRGCERSPFNTTLFPVERNKYNYLICFDGRFPFPQLPQSIDGSTAPVEFTIWADGLLDTTYGMPKLQYFNIYGTMMAETQATQVSPDGMWLKGWSNCLTNLPVGNYTVKIYNATANGVGQWLGDSDMYLYGGWIQNAIDDRSFFVRQQYWDFLNREPDNSGWTGWTNYIEQCGSDTTCANSRRIEVARGFMESAEVRTRIGGAFNPAYPGPGDTAYNREYVRQCYLTFLRREPGAGEADGWLNYLFSTGNYNDVIAGFINSGEYRARFEPEVVVEPVCDPSYYEITNCEQSGFGAYWDWNSCGCSYGPSF